MNFCPKCGGDSGVYDSRTRKRGEVARRRECKRCGERWATIEISLERFRLAERTEKTAGRFASLAERYVADVRALERVEAAPVEEIRRAIVGG